MDLKEVKVPRRTIGLVNGSELRVKDLKIITEAAELLPTEELIVLYKFSDTFEKPLELPGEVYVGVTQFRIFKLEDEKRSRVFRKNIVGVSHLRGGLFAWDKVVLTLTDATVDTFGIYHGAACKIVCEILSTKTDPEAFAAAQLLAKKQIEAEAARKLNAVANLCPETTQEGL